MLEYLLRQWLGRTVRQQAYGAARGAAFEHLSKAAESAKEPEPAPDRPADVGLIFSTALEAGAMEDRLEGVLAIEAGGLQFRQGGLGGRSIVVVSAESGPAAGKATEVLIAGHHPRWIVCAGFATGLQPVLARGDFLLANDVCNEQGAHLAIDLTPSSNESARPRVHCGRLITIDRSVTRVEEKAPLGAAHSALAADRQSFAVAEVCQREKTRFMSVRIINESVSDEPPRDVERLGRKKTAAARWGATLGTIVNRPSSLKDMLQAKEDSLAYADRLAKFLEGVIVQLMS